MVVSQGICNNPIKTNSSHKTIFFLTYGVMAFAKWPIPLSVRVNSVMKEYFQNAFRRFRSTKHLERLQGEALGPRPLTSMIFLTLNCFSTVIILWILPTITYYTMNKYRPKSKQPNNFYLTCKQFYFINTYCSY